MTDDGATPPESRRVVLLAYDGSAESANAIARAGELFSGRQAVVASVWPAASSLMLSAPLAVAPRLADTAAAALDTDQRQRAQILAAAGVACAHDAGFDASPVALKESRNVWHTLGRYAAEAGVAAVVVGARGRSRLATVALGSVSRGLIHHARMPVLMVPGGFGTAAPGPVVFGDDGSDEARRAITVGRTLLVGEGLVVTAWRPWVAYAPYPAVGAGIASPPTSTEIERITRDRAVSIAAEGAETAGALGADCAFQAFGFDGPTWRGLIQSANDRRACAIVVGARGSTAVARTLGSVSSAVAQHSPRPVLVVPPAQRP